MASAVDKQPAPARLSAVAAAGCLPTATRGNQSSYTTLWDTTHVDHSEIHQILTLTAESEFLDGDWFWYRAGKPARNRLRNASRRMLSVAAPIHVGVLREGLRRHCRGRERACPGSGPSSSRLGLYFAHSTRLIPSSLFLTVSSSPRLRPSTTEENLAWQNRFSWTFSDPHPRVSLIGKVASERVWREE